MNQQPEQEPEPVYKVYPEPSKIRRLRLSIIYYKPLYSFQGEEFGSISSIVATHPSRDVVVGGNSSGRVHVFM